MSGRDESRLYCSQCGVFHDAVRVERDNQVFWRVNCPKGSRDVRISSDARLYRMFRAQERPVPPWYRRRISNCIVHINDGCSLHCPICFEDAARRGWRMSLEDVRNAGRRIRQSGAVNVMLMGGEPTEHPEILEIVRILSHEFGFRLSMLTNGVRIGRDKVFAQALKSAGLVKASLSFDTFTPAISEVMRGDGQLIGVKLCAAENCFAAGLSCGFVVTASRLNLNEIPKIAAYFIAHAKQMPMMEIQCYQEAGRVVPGLESVDREEVIRELVASGVVEGLTTEEFRVTPFVPAAGFCISPDCGSGVIWRVRDGRATPLTREWGFDALLEDMALMTPGPRLIKWFKFILSGVRHVGLWFIPALWHWIGKGRPGRNELQLLSISTLMTPDKLDCQRFGRCTNGVLTAGGAFCSPCYYYCLRFDSERRSRK